MNKDEQNQLGELLSDIEGLHQLVSWQVALVREARHKVLALTSAAERTAADGKSRRRRR
jgi:hypothetical protein